MIDFFKKITFFPFFSSYLCVEPFQLQIITSALLWQLHYIDGEPIHGESLSTWPFCTHVHNSISNGAHVALGDAVRGMWCHWRKEGARQSALVLQGWSSSNMCITTEEFRWHLRQWVSEPRGHKCPYSTLLQQPLFFPPSIFLISHFLRMITHSYAYLFVHSRSLEWSHTKCRLNGGRQK